MTTKKKKILRKIEKMASTSFKEMQAEIYTKISPKNVDFYNLQKVRIRIQIHNTGRSYRKLVLLKRLCFGILVIEV